MSVKLFITKYALTTGIEEIECEEGGGGVVKTVGKSWSGYFHGEGREWHRTREAAVTRAKEMQTKKVAALKKQLAKLESKVFA